jgi:hypothetical protein
VPLFSRRLSALLLTLALSVSHVSVCAGWLATPEARMACCSAGGACPMHKGGSHESGSDRVITQAQADSCCASSEREESGQSVPSFAPAISSMVLGPAVALPASFPALVLSDRWRTVTPVPSSPVPKHVLLSVFLV